MEILKRCSTCKQYKPLTEFHKDKYRKDGLATSCKECACASSRKYYHAHREERMLAHREWYVANTDKARADRMTYYYLHQEQENTYAKMWKASHRDHIALYNQEYHAQYYLENADAIIERSKQYYAEHTDEVKARIAQWRKDNPDKTVVYSQNRRARINGSDGNWTADEWEWLFELLGRKCLDCGRTIEELELLGIPMTKDHIVPLAIGGSNCIENLQPLCRQCNSTKHTTIIDFRPQWFVENVARLKAEAGFGE